MNDGHIKAAEAIISEMLEHEGAEGFSSELHDRIKSFYAATTPVAQGSDYIDGVNIHRLRAAMTHLGLACGDSHEHVAASLAGYINRVTHAVVSPRIPRAASAPVAQQCPKCKYTSGDDWKQCNGSCPMPQSPHYTAPVALTEEVRSLIGSMVSELRQHRCCGDNYPEGGWTGVVQVLADYAAFKRSTRSVVDVMGRSTQIRAAPAQMAWPAVAEPLDSKTALVESAASVPVAFFNPATGALRRNPAYQVNVSKTTWEGEVPLILGVAPAPVAQREHSLNDVR